MVLPMVAYHPFEGTVNDLSERPRIQRSLGPTKSILLLDNHGPLVAARSVEAAFATMYNVTRACAYQQRAMAAVGGDVTRLKVPAPRDLASMAERARLDAAMDAGQDEYDDGAGVNGSDELVFRAAARAVESLHGAEHIYS